MSTSADLSTMAMCHLNIKLLTLAQPHITQTVRFSFTVHLQMHTYFNRNKIMIIIIIIINSSVKTKITHKLVLAFPAKQ
jgi:hypothetical protein